MSEAFTVDIASEETKEVLQLPVIKAKVAKAALQGIRPRIPILGTSTVPTSDDSLEQLLQHAGTLFGKDATRWEKVGDTRVDVSEQDGKRVVTHTGTYTGTELHLWFKPPYYDSRLPPRPDEPQLDFSVQQKGITSTEEWQQLIADQPWTPSRRRQLLLLFLQAKLGSAEHELQLEGARGIWELSINKPHHAEIALCHLKPLVNNLLSQHIEVSRACAAAVWGLAVNERSRAQLLQLGVVENLMQVAQQSLALVCIHNGYESDYQAGDKCTYAQRNQLQASVLGSLSVLVVDRACRKPLIAMEPCYDTLFQLSSNLQGYTDRRWAAARREAAAKTILSMVQRDHEARKQLMLHGGITKVLEMLDSKGPGHSKVQFAMAALLGTLVLDDEAMELIKQRGEGHLVFEATLKLLEHVLNALKFQMAAPGSQIPSDGMTQADIAAAMQQLRSQGSTAVLKADASSASLGLCQEASTASSKATQQQSPAAPTAAAATDEDPPEPLNVQMAVTLAEACAQAAWGFAHYSLEEPVQIKQQHVIELGKLCLDCCIVHFVDLGRVCHCLASTLASLASNFTTAGFIITAPGDSVVKAVIALLEVEDDPGFSNAGHVRAASSTCLAFLACHPIGAKGDDCLTGPFRTRLLQVGAFGALLKAALASSADEKYDAIIQQTAAVGIMYLSTMAGAVEPAELAMYAALITSNSNVQMVEYLMAGMWVLLKNPTNRRVLGGAFAVNPASSKIARNIMDKLQDTIDVADVSEAATELVKVRRPGTTAIKRDPTARVQPGAQQHSQGGAASAGQAGASKTGNVVAAGAAAAGADADRQAATAGPEAVKTAFGAAAGDTAQAAHVAAATGGVAADAAIDGSRSYDKHTRPTSSFSASSRPNALVADPSFGALAVEADSMEDKLKLVETKRRSVLMSSFDGAAPARTQGGSDSEASTGHRLSEALKAGPEDKGTIESIKNVTKSIGQSLSNLTKSLGSELHDNWGLDVLVRVGETWLPKLLESTRVPRGSSLQGGAAQPDTATAQEAGEVRATDVPLLKLFEFLTASMCLYVIEEEPACPLRRAGNVYITAQAPGRKGSTSWWTVAAPMIQAEEDLDLLIQRTLSILLTVLRLRLPPAWKIVQLSVVMLWNCAVQSVTVEHHQVDQGICTMLLEIINSRIWPPTLRDMASGHLQFLMESHDNLIELGNEWQQQRRSTEQQQQQQQQQGGRRGFPCKSPTASSRQVVSGLSDSSAAGFSPLPFDLAAMLNPTAAAISAAKSLSRQHQQHQQIRVTPLEEAMEAAGAHLGLVPVLSSFVSLIRTGHPLLELNGARGISRLCFAGSLGAPNSTQQLTAVKKTAAAVGATSVLVELLRKTSNKFLVLESGATLDPVPTMTHLIDKDYHIYEREVNNYAGVVQLLTANLAALLNLSTLKSNQLKMAKKGLPVLLQANTSLYQAISSKDAPSPTEMRLLDMLAAIISNLASHPDNRTQMYRAELAGTAALDKVLEGPRSPDPTDTSTAVLASRVSGNSALSKVGTAAAQKFGRASPSQLQPEHCPSPNGGFPQLSTSNSTSPRHGGPISHPLSASVDSTMPAAAVLRPKVVFPAISKGTVTGHAGAIESYSPIAMGLPNLGSPALPGAEVQQGQQPGVKHRPPGILTAVNGGTGYPSPIPVGALSCKSKAATSIAGFPGSPTSTIDSKDQFLIWMDTTFADMQQSRERGMSPVADVERKTTRRQMFDEDGKWLQPEPETSQALQRLMCRPLKHMWQDSPQARARAGKARWSPAVSEYRQANLEYPMQHAAEGMLTASAPAEVDDLMEATAELTMTGRCDNELVSIERPATRERQQGQVPMTVLDPAAGYNRSPQHNAPGPPDGHGTEQQQGAAGWGSETLRHAQEQHEAAHRLALKVVLSPQRPRTIISFENRMFSSDAPGSRPALTMFPHTEGAKVSQGLFTEYSLPNGRKAFMYYNGGNVMDEAEVGPVWPPSRPTTVPMALQQQMPLAHVLTVMAKPPGSAPPYVPWKPVPRLVPLPGIHTLTVARPEQRDAESYGHLRSDNLQLSFTAKAILKMQTTTTEESIIVQVAEEKEPWALPSSIFKPRIKEADAHAFYDGGATLDKMFERDWARACAKEKFTSMLARENKGNAAGKSDKAAMQDVHDMLHKHYQLFYSVFVYYASGGNDPYHMPLNSFTAFLDDASIPDPESLSIKRSDCDTIFIVCNFQPDKNSPDVAVNDEHAMMRFEFMEAIVRLALAKYGKGQATDDLGRAVELLFERNLLPRMNPKAMLVSNDFRSDRLYTEEVDNLLKQHQALLKALYSRYRLKPSGGGVRLKVLKLDGWLALMADAKLVDSQFTLADANLAFLWSRMFVIDGIKDYSRYTSLTLIDFLEALGRVADFKSLPTASDLDAAAYANILLGLMPLSPDHCTPSWNYC